jgi:Sulfotransferase domain
MRLIGAGLPRTATLSQKVALEMLGCGPCYHMVNVLGDLDEVPLWRAALDGEQPWQQIFGGYAGTVDVPGAFFYRELIETYPQAKVLLSVRDPESWERSMRNTILGVLYGDTLIRDLSTARGRVDPKWRAYMELMREMWRRSGLISGEQNVESEWIRTAMQRYNEQVVQFVPSDRLLVWSASDGWEPLCELLGVAVPDTPFPHLNDAEAFAERVIDGSLLALQEWRKQGAPPPVASK